MSRYIAFLRAINVGGHVVKMGRLRDLFEEMGFTEIETFIASGNVVFSSASTDPPTLESRIAGSLKEKLGYVVDTFVRRPQEVAQIVSYVAFGAAEQEASGNVMYVAFTSQVPTTDARERVLSLRTEVDDFSVDGREIYWLRRKAQGESRFSGAQLERALGQPATMRNMTTVRRIGAKYG